jgi:alkyl sulfatase BDS1-like metallo-beta-lactamase superfamily hydrolase
VFIVANLWRLYAGWWDQNPSHLQPARDADLGRELAHVCGGGAASAGVAALVKRADELAAAKRLDVASALIEVTSGRRAVVNCVGVSVACRVCGTC